MVSQEVALASGERSHGLPERPAYLGGERRLHVGKLGRYSPHQPGLVVRIVERHLSSYPPPPVECGVHRSGPEPRPQVTASAVLGQAVRIEQQALAKALLDIIAIAGRGAELLESTVDRRKTLLL